MKHILTLSAVFFVFLCIFTSCKKKYSCDCTIRTYVFEERDTVKQVRTSVVIRTTKNDAEGQCKSHQRETTYLEREAIDYYDCTLDDSDFL